MVLKEINQEVGNLEVLCVYMHFIFLIHLPRRGELSEVVSIPKVLIVMPNVFESDFHLSFIKLAYLLIQVRC